MNEMSNHQALCAGRSVNKTLIAVASHSEENL